MFKILVVILSMTGLNASGITNVVDQGGFLVKVRSVLPEGVDLHVAYEGHEIWMELNHTEVTGDSNRLSIMSLHGNTHESHAQGLDGEHSRQDVQEQHNTMLLDAALHTPVEPGASIDRLVYMTLPTAMSQNGDAIYALKLTFTLVEKSDDMTLEKILQTHMESFAFTPTNQIDQLPGFALSIDEGTNGWSISISDKIENASVNGGRVIAE